MVSIYQPSDFHVHLREGAILKEALTENIKHFQRILIMPNLLKPITNSKRLLDYRNQVERINNNQIDILYTVYLNENWLLADLINSYKNKLFFAAKLYPKNVTTNSSSGFGDIKKLSRHFEILEKNNIPLCLHGETITPLDDPYDREKLFLDKELVWLQKNFPNLKITLEHITTKEAVEYVKENKNIAASITTHHLLENTNSFLGDLLKPELFCKPIIKNRSHQIVLQKIALSGNKNFFFGSDSAPHLSKNKFNNQCCAGVYSSKYSVSNIIEFFSFNNKLKNLDKFLSINGNMHYSLNQNKKKLNYKKIKDYKFITKKKCDLDYLTHYNHYKDYWSL